MALMQSNNPAGGAKLPKTLFGYEVVDRIGEGAASTIYAVNHPKTHQLYALKHVIRKTEKDIRYVDQVENEFNVSTLFSTVTMMSSRFMSGSSALMTYSWASFS